MPISIPILLRFLLLIIIVSPSFSAFIAPITKHHVHNTPFYTLKLQLQTPLQPTYLLLHVGANFTTVNCRRNYTSTTSRPVPCNSSLCRSLQLQSNQFNSTKCDTDTKAAAGTGDCVISPHHSFALVDSLALPTTDGRNPGQLTIFPEFVFTCSDESSKLLKGHAKNVVNGLAGLGFSKFSLPAQVSSNSSVMAHANTRLSVTALVSTNSSVFAICISGSPSAPGVAFFSLVKPYYFLPGIDVSDHLYYTPIYSHRAAISTPKSNTKRYEDAYFVGLKSININGRPIIINQTLLTVDENGNGGTRISTINPYTVLEHSIFTAFIEAFRKESKTMMLRSFKSVRPFRLCYEADGLSETHLGPNVPSIELVMQNDVAWKVLGKNSMVRIVDEGLDVWCLAVVDGGVGSGSAVVIGGHQLEDNLLQFDLGTKTLGFSSTLLQHKTMCANFNFSTNDAIKKF